MPIRMSKFGQIPTKLICRFHELTKTEIIVLSYLYASRNKTGLCNPSRGAVARVVGIAKPHVSVAVKGLEDKGWVFEEPNGNFILTTPDSLLAEETDAGVTDLVTRGVTESVTEGLRISTTGVTDFDKRVTESVTLLNKESEHIEQRGRTEDFAPPINRPKDESLFYHPVIDAFRQVTRLSPPRESWAHLIAKVGETIHLPDLQIAFANWVAKGYKRQNFDGIADFYLERRVKENKNGFHH